MATFRSAGTAVEQASTDTLVVEYTLTAGDRLLVLASSFGQTAQPTSVVSDVDGALSIVGWVDSAREISLWQRQGATAGDHDCTITYPSSATVAAGLALGYDDADGTPSNVATNAVPTDAGNDTPNIASAVIVSGSLSGESFGWGMVGARFNNRVIAVAVSASTGLTLTATAGSVVHAADTSNFGFYIMDRPVTRPAGINRGLINNGLINGGLIR